LNSESRLLGLGNILVDEVYQIPRFPDRNGDVVATNHFREVGGGFNVLVSAHRLGMETAYAGAHGTGANADLIRSTLTKNGIGILQEASTTQDSGSCVNFLEPDGSHTFVTHPGAEASLQLSSLQSLKIRQSDFVYVSGYDLTYVKSGPILSRLIEESLSNQRIIFDPSPLIAEIPLEFLLAIMKRAFIISLNTDEFKYLSEIEGSACDCSLVIRQGPGGARVLHGLIDLHFPAPQVTAIDTTGAGDTHIGAMIAELARGASLAEAVKFANICAAISVTQLGPATAPTRAEAVEMLERNE
jgi:sugar/nucleoside kinase (ribokinase family)